MRVIIAGPRDLDVSLETIGEAVAESGFGITEVVSGAASKWLPKERRRVGADHLGEEWAKSNGIRCTPFPANWKEHGRKAGPMRNRQMAAYAEALIIVKRPGAMTRGTASMYLEATKSSDPLPTFVHEVRVAAA